LLRLRVKDMKSVGQIQEKIKYLEGLIEKSKHWEDQDEHTQLFRNILRAEISQLEWVIESE